MSTAARFEALFEGPAWADEPGCAAAVIQDGEVQWQATYGLAHLGARTPITPKTRFRICSITKLLFAVCAARLEAEGLWDLGAPATRHVPELKVPKAPTLRQLLAMQSGLCETYPMEWFGLGGAAGGVAHHQLLALHLAQTHQSFPPGERTLYTNANYMLLQLAAERATGRSCQELLAESVFAPAGMSASVLADGVPSRWPGTASAYAKSAEGFVLADPDVSTGAAGGVISSLEDMTAFVRWLRDDPYGWRGRLETPPPHLDGSSSGYGCGVGLRRLAGRRVLGHSGGIAGWLCELLWCPETDTAAIVLGNRSDQNWLERAGELLIRAWDAPPDPAMTPRLISPEAPPVAWSRTYATSDRSTSFNLQGAGDELLFEGRRFPPGPDGAFARNIGVEPIVFRAEGGIAAPPERLERTEGNVRQTLVPADPATAPDPDRLVGAYGRAGLPQPLRVFRHPDGRLLIRAGADWPVAETMELRHVLDSLYRVHNAAGAPQETHLRFELPAHGPAEAATVFLARILDFRFERQGPPDPAWTAADPPPAFLASPA